MGVRVIDDDDEDYCNSSCYSYDSLATTKTATTASATSKSSNHPAAAAAAAATKPHCHHESKTETVDAAAIFSRVSKDLIGNCKEFRIENNKSDLRIIGNGNRIRIGQNAGNLVIIGNSTRLKITKNSGHLKYTGNEGRICLGSESAQQTVDYIGCNGILKIKTVIEMEKSDNATATKAKKPKSAHSDAAAPLKVKLNTAAGATKSASFGGCESAGVGGVDADQWQQFKKMFKRENWQQRHQQINTSLPNLRQHQCSCQCGGKSKPTNGGSKGSSNNNNSSNSSVVTNVGNIVIRNAVNVRIAQS